MNRVIQFTHSIGAILSGVAMLALAITISAMNGDPIGVTLGFLSLVAGYFTSVFIVTELQLPRVVLSLGLTSWALAGAAMVAAVVAV